MQFGMATGPPLRKWHTVITHRALGVPGYPDLQWEWGHLKDRNIISIIRDISVTISWFFFCFVFARRSTSGQVIKDFKISSHLQHTNYFALFLWFTLDFSSVSFYLGPRQLTQICFRVPQLCPIFHGFCYPFISNTNDIQVTSDSYISTWIGWLRGCPIQEILSCTLRNQFAALCHELIQLLLCV